MKKILFITKISEFKNENSPNRYFFLKYLEQKPNIKLLDDVPSNSLNKWLQTNQDFVPDIIIYYFLSKGARFINISIEDFVQSIKNRPNILSAMIFEDSHYTDLVYKLYNQYNFKYFIQLGYNKTVVSSLKQYNIPFKLWNQYIDTTKFYSREDELKYDFLFYGYVDPTIYPLRAKIYEALKSLQKTHKEIKINIIEHGSYNKNILSVPTQEKLSVLLNQSRFSFATSSIYDLFLKKYIEIPLSGATTIGNIPSGYENLLKNNIIPINNSNTVNKIKQILIDAYRNNYLNIEMNTSTLASQLRSKYNYETGYNDLNKIASELTNEYTIQKQRQRQRQLSIQNKFLNKNNNNFQFAIRNFF